MPIIGSIGAAAASGFGQRKGGKPYNVAYFVVAGGGGAGVGHAGPGGGGGGFRIIQCKTHKVVTGKAYSITVGAGGTGTNNDGCNSFSPGVSSTQGGNSIFDTITSAGGGKGPNGDGGSGAGGGGPAGNNRGDGNVPPVSPPQGNPGGYTGQNAQFYTEGGGGGGAGAAGGNGQPGPGAGGAGASSGSFYPGYPGGTTLAGGGGAGGNAPSAGGPGGSGGGGSGGPSGHAPGSSGTDGLGGGGGGGPNGSGVYAGNGGSGVVMIKLVTACSPCSSGGTKVTSGDDSIHYFTGPGTFTA